MKFILLESNLGMCALAGVAQAEQLKEGPLEGDLKISELASLPQGMTVVLRPDTIQATSFGPTGAQWTHSTRVASTVGSMPGTEPVTSRNSRW
jgi:hypothetical protein